jgi:2-dehydrotetronate isomerase
MAIRLSANLGFLWIDKPLLERIELAARAGFRAVEMHWPYDTPALAVRRACEKYGLTLLSINTPQGDTSKGDAGLAAQLGRQAQFKDIFEQTLSWALESGASMIHVLPGMLDTHNLEAARDLFVKNLQWAADLAAEHGRVLLLEALNPRDKPGYFYHRVGEAQAIRLASGRDNVKLMFDVYHVGVTEGDILTKLSALLPYIGHIQIAGVPSRAEPDDGEVRYEAIFSHLNALGYTGWIGCEYKPRRDPESGLAWVSAMGYTL